MKSAWRYKCKICNIVSDSTSEMTIHLWEEHIQYDKRFSLDTEPEDD